MNEDIQKLKTLNDEMAGVLYDIINDYSNVGEGIRVMMLLHLDPIRDVLKKYESLNLNLPLNNKPKPKNDDFLVFES